MSLASLPSELLAQIFEDIRDTNSPSRDDKIRENAKTFMALRLISRRFNPFAARQLFRHFFLVINNPSWAKLNCIAQHPDFAKYLQEITIEARDVTPCQPLTDTLVPAFGLLWPASFGDQYVDFSWFPNLKSIECSKWRAVETGSHKLPSYKCVLHCPISRDEWVLWYYLSCFNVFSCYGFEFRSLNLNLASHFTWKTHLFNLKINTITSLDLRFDTYFGKNARDIYPKLLLPAIQDLPNLQIFKLDQSRYFGIFFESEKRRMTNIIGLLRNKSWPRLRRVELRNLVTRVADLEAFLMPHQGMLESVDLCGQLKCGGETTTERVSRVFLYRIIKYKVKPVFFRDWSQGKLPRRSCCDLCRSAKIHMSGGIWSWHEIYPIFFSYSEGLGFRRLVEQRSCSWVNLSNLKQMEEVGFIKERSGECVDRPIWLLLLYLSLPLSNVRFVVMYTLKRQTQPALPRSIIVLLYHWEEAIHCTSTSDIYLTPFLKTCDIYWLVSNGNSQPHRAHHHHRSCHTPSSSPLSSPSSSFLLQSFWSFTPFRLCSSSFFSAEKIARVSSPSLPRAGKLDASVKVFPLITSSGRNDYSRTGPESATWTDVDISRGSPRYVDLHWSLLPTQYSFSFCYVYHHVPKIWIPPR